MPVQIPPTNFPLQVKLGRMQIFSVGRDGNVYTRWKTSMDRNASWSNWQNLGPVKTQADLLVGYTGDGRMQIFGVANNNVVTKWKVTTDPNATWSASGDPR